MPSEGRRERIEALHFRTVGAVAPALLRDVVARVSRSLPLPCRAGGALDAIEVAMVAGRNQVDADRLLAAVEERATEPGTVEVALAAQDMGNPIFTHFFGRSRLAGRAAVVSLARLAPAFYGLPDDRTVTARRAAVEVVHEVGHVAGLRHCDDAECLMRLAHTVEAIDLRGTRFCDACRAALPHEFHLGREERSARG